MTMDLNNMIMEIIWIVGSIKLHSNEAKNNYSEKVS